MSDPSLPFRRDSTWHSFFRRYVAAIFLLNLIWEFAQLPLYSLWKSGSAGALIFSPIHCTAGDAMIATLSLIATLLILGNSRWPQERYGGVAAAAVALGFTYTVYSEWLNVYVRKSWAYSELMPLFMGIGVSPLLQWLIIPTVLFAFLSDRERKQT